MLNIHIILLYKCVTLYIIKIVLPSLAIILTQFLFNNHTETLSPLNKTGIILFSKNKFICRQKLKYKVINNNYNYFN
jgi:hypothetical protein